MNASQLTFLGVFGWFIAACALSFWLGRMTRDKEIKRLEDQRDDALLREQGQRGLAAKWEQAFVVWKKRATDAEGRLPKRGQHGQFVRQK